MIKLIHQGAEAKIFVDFLSSKFLDSATAIKQRTKKSYRHPQLDNQIRTRRTKSEAKLLTKALSIKANVPKVDSINKEKNEIYIQYIEGDRLSETLSSYPEKQQFKIMQQLGEQIALLHTNNIIHGDLTTSNTILSDNKVFIIDFGLGFISTKIEDKAVDLHLIKQALQAKHFRSPDHLLGQNHQDLFKHFLKGYQHQDSKKITERLTIVEKRGRYKH